MCLPRSATIGNSKTALRYEVPLLATKMKTIILSPDGIQILPELLRSSERKQLRHHIKKICVVRRVNSLRAYAVFPQNAINIMLASREVSAQKVQHHQRNNQPSRRHPSCATQMFEHDQSPIDLQSRPATNTN